MPEGFYTIQDGTNRYMYTYIHTCIYIYMCVFIFIHIHIYIYLYINIYTHTYILYRYVYVHIHVYIYIYMHMTTHIDIYIYTFVYIYTYVCIYVCIYAYTYIRYVMQCIHRFLSVVFRLSKRSSNPGPTLEVITRSRAMSGQTTKHSGIVLFYVCFVAILSLSIKTLVRFIKKVPHSGKNISICFRQKPFPTAPKLLWIAVVPTVVKTTG